MRFLPLSLALGLMSSPALAAPPDVVTDIPPVHSLVAQVMEGVGQPQLLLPPGGSPHGHQMRPSEARRLRQADLLFWIGPDQSPWLEDAAGSLGQGLTSIPLMEIDGTILRLGGHDHGEEDHGEAEAGHDTHDGDHAAHGGEADHADHGEDDHAHDADHGDHGDHGHADEARETTEPDAHKAGDGHDHEGVDPHVWLDPGNARVWLPEILRHLVATDPDNAATYRANAETAMRRLTDLTGEIEAKLGGLSGGYIVFHDAYGYFTDRFDLPPSGTIADGDATMPGARRLAELQSLAKGQDVQCLFTEPQFDSRVASRLAEALDARVGVLDPIGSSLEPGPGLYAALLTSLADGLASCLAK